MPSWYGTKKKLTKALTTTVALELVGVAVTVVSSTSYATVAV